MKKVLAFFFILCLVALLVPSAQAVDSGTCGEGVTWALSDDGTLTISGSGAMVDYASSSEAPWYSQRTSVKTIVIEGGVTTIGDRAFFSCTALTEVSISAGVQSIGTYAFLGCSSLTSISIPESVIIIGDYAFSGCKSLISVTIPERVDSVGDSAFAYCSSLTSITIPDGVTSIGISAFGGCSNLNSITIPNSVAVIHNNAFDGCWNLKDVFYEGDLAGWCGIVFDGGTGANPLSKTDNLYINGELLAGEIIIPNNVTSIGNYSFSFCSALTGVTIPDSVASIGYGAFIQCENLNYITIPNSVTRIGDSAFAYCSSLTSITIPDDVTSIEPRVFESCIKLRSITIPSSVTSIRDEAFRGCSSLNVIHYIGTETQSHGIMIDDYGNSWLDNVLWHCGVTADVVAEQTVYYCVECNLHYLCDGTEYVPVTKPNLTGKSFSLSFEDEILVNFYYTVTDVDDVVEQGMLVFYANPDIADITKADDVYTESTYDSVNDLYSNTTNGIAAKYMGDNRYYCAYAKLTDGGYAYSPLYQYSPQKYAMNMLGKDTASDKQKTLCVAMLNYGAAAQKYFGYKTEDLMNGELTAEQQALVTPYDACLFAGAVAADPGKAGVFTATEGFSGRSASVSFEGAFSINFYFTPNAVMDSKLVFYYWTAEDYANAETLSVANASGKLIMEQRDGVYMAAVEGIAPKDLDKTYYVAGAYMSDMQIHCTGVIAYSLSKYCMNNATGNMGALAQATAMYGYYANQYFA